MVTNLMLSSFHIPLIFEILNLFGRKGLCLLISTPGFDKKKKQFPDAKFQNYLTTEPKTTFHFANIRLLAKIQTPSIYLDLFVL